MGARYLFRRVCQPFFFSWNRGILSSIWNKAVYVISSSLSSNIDLFNSIILDMAIVLHIGMQIFFCGRPAGAFYKSREGMMMLQRRELLVPFHTEPSGELPECYSDIFFLCMSKSGTFLRSNCSLAKEMWVPCHAIHVDLCDSNLQSATRFPSTGIQ